MQGRAGAGLVWCRAGAGSRAGLVQGWSGAGLVWCRAGLVQGWWDISLVRAQGWCRAQGLGEATELGGHKASQGSGAG